jgi:O-antigen ligase
MLPEGGPVAVGPAVGDLLRPPLDVSEPRPGPSRLLRTAVPFLAAAGLVVAYALPGGSYDIVIRQEYGFVVWALIAAGFATGLLPRSRPAAPALVVIGALCAYAAWTGASLAWSQSAERTTTELVRSVDYVGLALLIASVVDRGIWRSAAGGLLAGATVVCGLSVASRLAPTAFPPNLVESVLGINRLSYPFGYWNAVGAWGAMTLALGLGWSSGASSTPRRVLTLTAMPVVVTMVYLSYSRTSVVAVALAVALVVAIGRHRWTAMLQIGCLAFASALAIAVIRDHPEIADGTGTSGAGSVLAALVVGCAVCAVGSWLLTRVHSDDWHLPRQVARGMGASALVIALLALAAVGPHLADRAWKEFRDTTAPAQGINPTQRLTTLSGSRYSLWATALRSFDNQPLTGTGAGTFEFDWNRGGNSDEFVLNAHSIWFESLAELGAPGLVLVASFLSAAIVLLTRVRLAARRRTAAAGATAAIACFGVFVLCASVDWMWQSTAVTVLAIGTVMTAGARLGSKPGRFRVSRPGRVGLALLASAAVCLQIPGLLSTLDVRNSQAAERRGDPVAALGWARSAVAAEPWAASPDEQEALVLESGNRLSSAATFERRAIDREPTNYTHWLVLARIQAERGRVIPALSAYDKARSLSPRGLIFTFQVQQLASTVAARRG